MNKAIYICLFAFVLASCTRNSLSDPVAHAPIFKGNFSLDGTDTEIAAGINGFYLEPTFHKGANGVLAYVASFKNHNNDFTNLEIVIQDDSWELPTAQVQPDVALAEGSLLFQEDNIALKEDELVFCSFAGTEGKTYLWTINGQEYTDAIPAISLDEPGENLYAEVLITDDASGCQDALIQGCEVFDDSGLYGNYYYETFSVTPTGSGNQMRLTYAGDYGQVASIRWDIIDDGGAIVVHDLEEVIHNFATPGPHLVTITVEMQNGHTFRYADKVATSDEVCTANMHYLRPPLGEPATSRVRVNYTSPEGVKYTSFIPGVTDASENSFEIVSIEDYVYHNYASGVDEDARRLNVAFSCILYNVENTADQITIEGFEGTLAVSFPQ